jgi:hypothetical protein
MKNIRTNLFILGLLLIMSGCEYAYNYSYTVTNKSDGNIKVYVKTFRIDSTFSIPKDSTKKLFIDEHGIEGSKGPYFSNVTDDLKSFKVIKNDTLMSTRDYLKNDTWTFKKGDYSTTVINDEFK